MSLTQDQRTALFDALDRLPEPYGYTLRANKDGSYSMTIGGKQGHTKGRYKLSTKGTIHALIADANEFLRMLDALGKTETQP